MELGRTENSEIIFIHTDDLEVTICYVQCRLYSVCQGEGEGRE